MTGSLVWGVYRYRLHNLPLFIPPAHGLVYLTGLALAAALAATGARSSVAAAAIATGWAVLGLTVLPQRDVAGAVGVPLLLVFLWRSRSRAVYAGRLPRRRGARAVRDGDRRLALGARAARARASPDGNPPSGVASGYVWFDVMALLVAPWLLGAVRTLRVRAPAAAPSAE